MTEATYFDLAVDGDEGAIVELFDKFSSGFAYYFSSVRTAVLDVGDYTQEAFLIFYKNLELCRRSMKTFDDFRFMCFKSFQRLKYDAIYGCNRNREHGVDDLAVFDHGYFDERENLIWEDLKRILSEDEFDEIERKIWIGRAFNYQSFNEAKRKLKAYLQGG